MQQFSVDIVITSLLTVSVLHHIVKIVLIVPPSSGSDLVAGLARPYTLAWKAPGSHS